MANVLITRSSGQGLSPGQGLCVVLLGKIFNSHAPLCPGVWVPANFILLDEKAPA